MYPMKHEAINSREPIYCPVCKQELFWQIAYIMIVRMGYRVWCETMNDGTRYHSYRIADC